MIFFIYIRYTTYNKILQFKPIEEYTNTPNDYNFDNNINNNINTIEADYENKDITMVGDSYNICYLRQYLLSHPTDATIQLAEIKDNMTILDVGSGTGMVAIYMCKQFPNIKIDCIVNTSTLFNIITKNITSNNMTNRIKVYIVDFNKELPMSTNINYYDRVLFLESIGYSTDRLNLIKHSYNLLKKGGKLFIKSPSFDSNIPKKYNDKINKIINKWGYNFSTIGSLINDIKKVPFTSSKYISIKLSNCIVFHNISDIFKGLHYCYKNKINLFEDLYIGLKYMNSDFILATK